MYQQDRVLPLIHGLRHAGAALRPQPQDISHEGPAVCIYQTVCFPSYTGAGVLVLRCGPNPMMVAMKASLDELGYSEAEQFQF